MIDFAALSPVKTAATALDPTLVAGAGLANSAAFEEILAETLEAPSLAAAAPVFAVPPAVGSRQPATGIVLPEPGETLPGGPPQFAQAPEKTPPERPAAPPARRRAHRTGNLGHMGKVSPRSLQPVPAARTSAATPPSTTLGIAGSVATPAEPGTRAKPGGEPLVPVAAEVPIAATPTPIPAFNPSPAPIAATPTPLPAVEPSPAPARRPVPLAPTSGFPVDSADFPPRHTGERLPASVALLNVVEPLAAKAPVISPTTPVPVVPVKPLAPGKAGPLPLPAVAVPGPVLRVAAPGVRVKSVVNVEPAPSTIALPASLASRGSDETAYPAPLAAPVSAGALPPPIEALSTSAPTAPPAATTAARQDFVALVERLIDSRSAAAPAPVQAALAHSEFGEIALRFTTDERGLNVAMVSADPDFAPAVQAALPAERSERTAPEQPRGQPGASLPQGTSEDRGAHHAASQSRSTPERTARLTDPEPGSRDEDRPARRAGIFA